MTYFHKAFDSIKHTTICNIFVHLKAPASLVAAINSMYSEFKIRVDTGHGLSDDISIKRGTFQGHPLSGLIFAMVIEPLNRALSGCDGILYHDFKLTHLLYADDLITFHNSLSDYQMHVVPLLSLTFLATCLSLNEDKCTSLIKAEKLKF